MKSKVYTRSGDKGKTSLVGGTRVPKGSIRLDAYGTIDELNSFIGLLLVEMQPEDEQRDTLRFIQHKLFSVGGYLATEPDSPLFKHGCSIGEEDVARLERAIDRMDGVLPQLKGFVLPGGDRASATAHVCRTVCRRAERIICSLSDDSEVADEVMRFVNRLSDYLFVLARKLSLDGEGDIYWDKGCE